MSFHVFEGEEASSDASRALDSLEVRAFFTMGTPPSVVFNTVAFSGPRTVGSMASDLRFVGIIESRIVIVGGRVGGARLVTYIFTRLCGIIDASQCLNFKCHPPIRLRESRLMKAAPNSKIGDILSNSLHTSVRH